VIVPLMRPVAESVKLSLPVPPVTFSMSVKALAPFASVSEPAFAALIAQVLVMSLPVRVSTPVPPPVIVPLMRPVAESVKLSLPVPPMRFSIPVNVLVLLLSTSVPALGSLISQVLVAFLPVNVSVPVPPFKASGTTELVSRKLLVPLPAFTVTEVRGFVLSGFWAGESSKAEMSTVTLLPPPMPVRSTVTAALLRNVTSSSPTGRSMR
jgi:hypothetical protein